MPRNSSAPSAKKSLGQHFLHDQDVLERIAGAVPAGPGETVVEIGPGTGELTAHLVQRFDRLLALELDERMIAHLQHRFADAPGFRVLHGDARDYDVNEIVPPGTPYHVVGNLPYFAANPIVRRFLEAPPRPKSMVVMVQREVAREMAVADGNFSLLGISIQVYATTELLFDVPPTAFEPPPKVTSTVLRITPREMPLITPEETPRFFKLVGSTFKNPRKQVHNSLSRGSWLAPETAAAALAAANIDPTLRPERLSIDDWLRLMAVSDRMAGLG
jgi:16S rRNA (adenine1518-N6/adenine1519-N6)-dimethyltransferase